MMGLRLVQDGVNRKEFAARFRKELSQVFAKEIEELVGIDITGAALELSRKHAANMGVTNAKFELGDCLKMEYVDKFDVVWSQGLMEHFDYPEKVAAEHYKATKPGGIVA